jgi:hypothetical protein
MIALKSALWALAITVAIFAGKWMVAQIMGEPMLPPDYFNIFTAAFAVLPWWRNET